MNVVPERLPANQPLAERYINDFASVSSLYNMKVTDPQTWAQRAAWLDQSKHSRIDRGALVNCLEPYNRLHNNHEAVQKSLELLRQDDTLTIVGGQQSGLFTGPLLVIYKVVTLILGAREASARLNRPVVPVFWIAGEDHDWDEVNHTYLPDRDGQAVKIRMDHERGGHSPVSRTSIDHNHTAGVLKQFESLLPDSEHKSEWMQELRQYMEQSDNLSHAFAKQLGRLFGRFGVILLDSDDSQLRRLEVPVFRQMIQQNDRLTQAYLAAAEKVRALGYEEQATVAEDSANLFYIHSDEIYTNERILLFKRDGMFTDRKGLVTFTPDELLDMLEQHPERFSNNVLTRPLMQESLFPVLSTILGTGEIAYWALTHQAFEVLDLQMPPILPRMSFTMIEEKIQMLMKQFGLSFDDVRQRFDEVRTQWLSEQEDYHLDERFAELRRQFDQMYLPFIESLAEVDPSLPHIAATNQHKIEAQIEYLHRKSSNAVSKQHEVGLRRLDRIAHSLYPFGKPQERTINSYYYFGRYGEQWLDQLLSIEPDLDGGHRLIYM
ncbi:bacillithiol biosynthesis cysteine-adding enzyme BshC [Paenibacillus bovis]|uniref:Putative cysteine ligase BshC n=1 Tax=Paenibacillus bovis TaxID=1616788 RepID=A0A172ZJ93_9BACL|nr:bacillithiol biosynthesis cysteine-adding enzyme BshC [Paenibacillus bovis]ANF97701.1 bacillithiol biosynthesis cysteine-adding enzyme BshC [Paenibacillus bovis]